MIQYKHSQGAWFPSRYTKNAMKISLQFAGFRAVKQRLKDLIEAKP